jgi:hypothetical protein
VRTSVRIPQGTKEIVCVPGCSFAYVAGVSERAALAIIEAPVVYAVHIVAPLPLLYAINQVQLTTHNYIMQRVPWEWEVSADLFIRDVAGKGRTASADECWQTQRSDSSRRFMHS